MEYKERKSIEEIMNEMEESEEAFAVPEPKPSKVKAFWNQHKLEIVMYGITALAFAGCGLAIAKQLKNGKIFENEIKAKYGQNATAGSIFCNSPKKLLDQNKIWEEKYKGNFDSVMDLVRSMDIKEDETFTIEKVFDEGKPVTQVIQFIDGGYYHGDLC